MNIDELIEQVKDKVNNCKDMKKKHLRTVDYCNINGELNANLDIIKALEQLKEEQEQLIKKHPNDADLGKAVRLNQNKKFKQL